MLVIAFLSGCGTDRGGQVLAPLFFASAGGDSVNYYGEPNNTIAEATDVPTNNRPIRQTFHLMSDVDYFHFSAATGAQYVIRTEELDPGVQTDLEIRDASDRILAMAFDGSPEEGAAMIEWTAPVAGSYYIRVSPAGGDVGAYSLRISVGADSYEPDNTLQQAGIIGIDGLGQQHTIHDRADEDYVVFHAWAGFAYRVALEWTDTTGTLALAVLDSSGNELASNAESGVLTLSFTASGDEPYYVRIAPRGDEAVGTYRVIVVPGDDPQEPDGTLQQAKEISTDGRAQRHSFSSVDDEDYVWFTTVAGARYTITTDSLSEGVDTQIEVNSPSGAALVADEDGGGGERSLLQWTAPLSGIYYVRVRSAAGGLPGTYVLRLFRE